MRQTSIDVYHQIRDEGLLSKRRLQVYETIYLHGPITQMETAKIADILDHSVTPRFAELEKMGVIATVGERDCTRTGRKVLMWDVTGRLPTKFEKPHTRKCPTCKGSGILSEQQAKFDI